MTRRADTGPLLARRILDVAVAGAALLGVVPLVLLLAVAIRLTSPGPAFFRQVRVGQDLRCFTMYKLRSMRVGGPGGELTAPGDARVTALGALCRRTSLDELPQLWNVLRGDMTLVGPRPETPALAADYPPECRWVLRHRPGITGPAQLRFRDRTALPRQTDLGSSDRGQTDLRQCYLTELVPQRVAVDAQYLEDPTLRRTVQLLWDTAGHLLGLTPERRHEPVGGRSER